MDNPLITVFTPAYNRAKTLSRTYESLKKQNNKGFIWLIIDDGSTDNTKEIVKEWQKNEKDFAIEYIYKENGGMHTAHNAAYENITTTLNMCVDSDDALALGAIDKIYKKWDEIKNKNYAGIIALDSDFEGGVIGKGFPENLTETTLSGYYAKGGKGDKKLIYRTDVIKKYPPYPVFPNEKYLALAYKYKLIDNDYKLAVLNEVICLVEYRKDGSSASMFKQYVNNPKGFALWRKISLTYPDSKKRLIIDNIHYVSSSILSKNSRFLKESPTKFLTAMSVLPGAALTVYVKGKAKND